MSSYIDTIMLIVSVIFLIMAAACMFALIYLIILGIRGTDPVIKDDDEEQAEYIRQYSKQKAEKKLERDMRKEEKKRARAVSRELRRERFCKNHHGKGASAKDKGDCVLPEENPEGAILPGQNQEGD